MPLNSGDPESIGDYRLEDRLGSGGMGVVYLARSSSGRRVAVKVVHEQFAQDEEFRIRFRQEVAAARQVSGAFTAPVVDADPDTDRPWMATLYVPGPTLAERLSQDGPLDSVQLRGLALGLAEALHDIHRAGVVHRDLKPANVLMAQDGPRVIDFGISRAGDNQALTVTGRVMGTPPFMSPEQLSRPREVTPASDVFSLGALLVYAATGRGPFDADSPYMTAYQVVHEPPALDDLAEPLRLVVADCLAKDPAARPGLPELSRRLRDLPGHGSPRAGGADASGGTGASAAAPAEYEHTSAGRRRRRTMLAAGVAVASLAAVVGGVLVYTSSGDGVRTSANAAARDVPVPRGWHPWQLDLSKAAGTKPYDSDLSPRCLAADTTLYCGGTGFRTLRVDGLAGRVDWRAKGLLLESQAADDESSLGPANSAPFATGDGLVYLHDSPQEEYQRLVALDADSGEVVWSHRVSSAANSALVGDLVISNDPKDEAVVARDAATGEERWTTPMPEGADCAPVQAPTDGVPYAGCLTEADDSDYAVLLLRFDKKDGDAHRVGRPGEVDEPLGVHDGDLLFLPTVDSELDRHDRLVRLDPRTGKRSEVKLPPDTIGRATLVGDRLFFVQESGRVTLVDPADGEQVWSTPTSVERLGPPTVAEESGAVYLGTASGRLLALDVGSGDELWQTPARSASTGWIDPPGVLVVRGMVTGLTSSGTVFSLDPRHPDATP
ncbi:PQQ-binding-like beta-propeller repeat protein [Streptomyces sp. NPDC018031]|uniref:serine/threonine-protein kinase n=1 Tax=Streptomyces sp. NPDC018031 TaxID=3365033 RepID=UPI0037B0D79D